MTEPTMHDETVLRTDTVAVALTYLEEGFNGDFDANDPEDEPLLRLDVMVAASTGYPGEEAEEEGWVVPANSSICTNVSARTSPERIRQLLVIAAAHVDTAVRAGESLRPVMERWAITG